MVSLNHALVVCFLKLCPNPHYTFKWMQQEAHSTARALCLSLWTGGMPVARAALERRLWGCSPVTWLSAAGLVMSVWGAPRPVARPCFPTQWLPGKRKGCRLPMATAQEMKNKGSFWNLPHSVRQFGEHKELKYSWTNLSLHSHFKTIYSAQHQCQHVLISQYLNIPFCFDRNRMTQI